MSYKHLSLNQCSHCIGLTYYNLKAFESFRVPTNQHVILISSCTARWLPNVSPMTARWQPDDSPMTAWWLPDDCMTARWLPIDCSMTAQWLPDDCPMTAWWLPNNCLVTTWWLADKWINVLYAMWPASFKSKEYKPFISYNLFSIFYFCTQTSLFVPLYK